MGVEGRVRQGQAAAILALLSLLLPPVRAVRDGGAGVRGGLSDGNGLGVNGRKEREGGAGRQERMDDNRRSRAVFHPDAC